MMDKIIAVWTGRSPPTPVSPDVFKNKDAYELYQLVCHAAHIRAEVDGLRGYHGSTGKMNEALIYQQAILAKVELDIEKKLIKMRSGR